MKNLNVLKFSLGVFITLFIISAIDITLDFEDMGTFNTHIWVEMFMGLISLIAFSVLWLSIRHQEMQLETVHEDLTQIQNELEETSSKVQKLANEFSKMVFQQFDTWGFTESEREVALLLLKGLSTAEIADVRETKEKTVRQQASNLYKKAELAGRHELAAYFFEDLLLNSTPEKS